MHRLLPLLLFGLLFQLPPSRLAAQAPPQPKPFVKSSDFNALLKNEWAGSLNVVENPGDSVKKIPAVLVASLDSTNNLNWTFLIKFPGQSDLDHSMAIKISPNGRKLNQHKVTARAKSKIGTLQLVTLGKAKGAFFRHTYFLNFDTFGIQMEEKQKGEEKFIVTRTYLFHRK